MSSLIQKRSSRVQDLLIEVKNHCMCLNFTEDDYHYLVYYPEGMRVDGARVEKGNNKSIALERLIKAMDRHWDESGIN